MSVPPNRVVYGIGDSLMINENGPGTPLFHLQAVLGDGAYLKAQGVGGETSAHILARVERDVVDQSPRPDTCVVLAGVNDIQAGARSSTIVANLEATYRILLGAGVHPIALTIYPFGGFPNWTRDGEAVRQEVREWMKTALPARLAAVEVVDVEDVIGDLTDKDRPRIRAEYVDHTGLHTSSAGAAAVAQALVDRTQSFGSSQG